MKNKMFYIDDNKKVKSVKLENIEFNYEYAPKGYEKVFTRKGKNGFSWIYSIVGETVEEVVTKYNNEIDKQIEALMAPIREQIKLLESKKINKEVVNEE